MEILLEELIRLVLIQMQRDTALSDSEKKMALEKLERRLETEGWGNG